MSIKRHALGPTYEIHKQCRDNEIMWRTYEILSRYDNDILRAPFSR